jgi:spermidine synthase
VQLAGDRDRPGAWTLLVDGTPQSHVDLDDPLYLEFEYMRRIGHLVDLAAPAGDPLRVLHLGGGGLTLARYVAATRPGSSQLAVESDAALAELVRRRLPLGQRGRRAGGGRAGRVRVRVADARAVLAEVPAGSFDMVVADLFTGGRTAAHVTSAEFTIAVASALAPAGIYVANVGDGPRLAHARARVATVRAVFPHACLVADAAVLRGRRFGNLVVAAARRERGWPAGRQPTRSPAGSCTAASLTGSPPGRSRSPTRGRNRRPPLRRTSSRPAGNQVSGNQVSGNQVRRHDAAARHTGPALAAGDPGGQRRGESCLPDDSHHE